MASKIFVCSLSGFFMCKGLIDFGFVTTMSFSQSCDLSWGNGQAEAPWRHEPRDAKEPIPEALNLKSDCIEKCLAPKSGLGNMLSSNPIFVFRSHYTNSVLKFVKTKNSMLRTKSFKTYTMSANQVRFRCSVGIVYFPKFVLSKSDKLSVAS